MHESGVPWQDQSGDTLREWLQLTPEQFYDERMVVIVPSGFCYPGKGVSGDLPPRPECAPLWHPRLLAVLPDIRLTLLVGSYAQAYYLSDQAKPTLTETVASFAEYLPRYFPLPHPSPRNRPWLSRNRWFATEAMPVLRERIATVLPSHQLNRVRVVLINDRIITDQITARGRDDLGADIVPDEARGHPLAPQETIDRIVAEPRTMIREIGQRVVDLTG